MPENTPPGMSRPLQAALDAVETVGEAGLALAPSEPSPAMLAAGARAGGVGVELARRIYRAMVAAAD